MKVVFLGNHTVGVCSLSAIAKTDEIVGVVAHPPDPEDGVQYESVYDYALSKGWNVIRGKAIDIEVTKFISKALPDLIWITDYRYLVPVEIIRLPQKGVVNLHPSLLPKYRGRAPINWAILKGEEEVGLTAHYVDEGMDTGDIIQQVPVSLDCYEDVGDALSKFMPLYAEMTVSVLNSIRNDSVNRTPQDHLEATTFPARRPEDGLIYWDHPAKDIVNLVRAVTKPYPGAFTHADGKKIVVWKAEIVHNNTNVEPGVITKIKPNVIEVACGRGSMRLLNYEPSFKPNLGQALG